MKGNISKTRRAGQSILEYIALVGLVVAVLVTMSTSLRRGVQGMVRMVSDQLGDQKKSEQPFDETGHLVNSLTSTNMIVDKQTIDRVGTINYIFNDQEVSQTDTFLNLGFTERQQN